MNKKADIVVYGDAAGGVTAAVQAARMNKSVILVSQFSHLGGMTASGLGWSDIGNDAILGGLSREFYHRVYKHYMKESSWHLQSRESYGNKGQVGLAFNPDTELASTFEPKVAEAIFDEMVKDAGVEIVNGRIDLKNGVSKNGDRIITIHLEDGTSIAGDMFIDASYEGDLLELAGVSFVVGREANAQYNEEGNGNTGPLKQNQLIDGIDPYIEKGNPTSGLLPGVNETMGGNVGDADHRLQAYCYRMVLSDKEENRLPISKPLNYDIKEFEILLRAIEVGERNEFFKTTMVPNHKSDSNNTGGISCDYIGANYGDDWNWVTLDHNQRDKLAAEHRDWQLGLLWTLQNNERVPDEIKNDVLRWGLPKDEFADNNNWPYNIYVREGRRMVSDFVMTEGYCKSKVSVDDSVGMGAYTLDSHNTQRFINNGMVKNEGDIQRRLYQKPYGIAYRSIIPKKGECENLVVPWALSASHIAFGSIRMEPVFMILGQSAATAACMAIDNNTSVQDVPYEALRKRLLADGQFLEFSGKMED